MFSSYYQKWASIISTKFEVWEALSIKIKTEYNCCLKLMIIQIIVFAVDLNSAILQKVDCKLPETKAKPSNPLFSLPNSPKLQSSIRYKAANSDI